MIIINKYEIKYKDLKNNNKFAIACFDSNNDSKYKIKGTVKFSKDECNQIKIDINLSGLIPNHQHGFHVHEAGDLSEKCKSACAHFNPYNKTHGCPGKKDRHVGDLGNIQSDQYGNANYSFYDDVIKLYGRSNIIGRALVIHKDTDDCGFGIGDLEKTSLITGNSGDRIACAIIGYSKDNFIN